MMRNARKIIWWFEQELEMLLEPIIQLREIALDTVSTISVDNTDEFFTWKSWALLKKFAIEGYPETLIFTAIS